MIHVCFCLHDKTGRYSKFTGTAMLSIFENLPLDQSICVHILHDNTLTPDNRDKFIYLAKQYGQIVKFYNVEETCAEKIAEFLQQIPAIRTSFSTIGTFFKLLIPQVLPADIEKCIYLDSDIAVNLDINELWRIELGDKPLAGVSERICGTDTKVLFLCTSGIVNHDEYFNAGVLLLNLNFLRNEGKKISEGVKFRGEHPESVCFDQDVWNYCFAKTSLKLPAKFDVFTVHARTRNEPFGRKIYHYVRDCLQLDTNDPFNRLWLKYFIKTPWFDEESIGRLYGGVQQLHVGLKNSMAKLSAIMSGKSRIFFILPQLLDMVKKYFKVQDDEKIILVENMNSVQDLFCEMRSSAGKKVFFILIPNFPFNILLEAGFVNGRDFINGFEFLSEAHGVPLNSHELIKEM